MSKIVNKPTNMENKVVALRKAIEHRATWMYYLLDEAKKAGCDMEKIGRAAVYRCGCFHGENKFKKTVTDSDDLREFLKVFADGTGQKIFDMEIVENDEHKLYVDFHYCPLVEAWQKLGVPDEELPLLCDIAMEGDRGIVSKFDGYIFDLESVIAKGEPVCKIRINKK